MTLVRVALDVPGSAGNVRAVGRVRATPTLRRTVGDAIVLPAPFSAALVLGVATVELAPTAANWCWRIEELTAASATRYVAVPDSELTLGYEDLVDVDPATLDPTVEPEAAWTAALGVVADDVETLDGRVAALEEAPPAAVDALRFVLVTTGDEPRPDGDGLVVWRDIREDRTIPPANMGPYDWSVAAPVEEEEPPPSDAFSVYGAAAPTGSWSLGTDGTPYIMFGRGFYTFDSADATNGLPNGRVVGGRVWIPAGATGLPTEATFYLFGPAEDFDGTPVQTKVVDLAGVAAGEWVEATFDTPQDMGADGDVWAIGVRFTGGSDGGKYVFGTGTRPDADAVVSLSGKNFAWSEQSGANLALSSIFKIGTGASGAPGEQTHSYGVDILIDEGV